MLELLYRVAEFLSALAAVALLGLSTMLTPDPWADWGSL